MLLCMKSVHVPHCVSLPPGLLQERHDFDGDEALFLVVFFGVLFFFLFLFVFVCFLGGCFSS